MATEPRRGCGYRKVGGIYLEGAPGPGFLCGRLPLPILPCPLCDHTIPFSRGLARANPRVLTRPEGPCATPERCPRCPLGKLLEEETVGLMWVGERFYSPESFTEEALRLGVSKRVATVPRWLELGKSWVLLAHPKVIRADCPECKGAGGWQEGTADALLEPCEACEGSGRIWKPGIFSAFRPTRLVKLVTDRTPEEELARLRKRGLEPVVVPHDDPDHANPKGDETDGE